MLCVDDERVARTVMVEMLRGRGVRAEAEEDPRAALERLKNEPFDVLVTDLSMPTMDGIELVLLARRLPRPPGCVLVTSIAGSSLDLSGLPLGTVAGVVAKPFSDIDLWEVVDQAARASRRSVSSTPTLKVDLLVVEDNQSQAALVSSLLEGGGLDCQISVCGRLDDALEQLTRRSFGTAIVDLNLPDARGLDVVRRIRTVSPETPIVVLTEDGETWGEAAMELGAQEVLLKSAADQTELVAAVQRALRRRSAEKRAASLAFRDALTGLFNARYFLRRLAEAVALSAREGKPSAVFLIDLDGFKPINDTYGHASGDIALKEVAARLRDALRDYDTVARLGGDEFVVLVHGIDDRNVLGGLAQRMLELISRPIRVDQTSLAVGASIGVAIAPECANEPGKLLRVADRAMYAAKAAGKGTVRFALGPLAESSLPPSITLSPPASAPRIFLHTQIDARDKRQLAHRLELALLEDPERSTADVLRSMARLDRDVELVMEALTRALAEAQPDEEISLTVPSELFGTRLLDALRASSFAHSLSRITFEAHAPSLLAGSGSLTVMLQAFQDAGCRIAMRDFGSAAMRPDVLSNLPLDALRLDPRLLARAGDGGSSERLVRGLVAFGQALGFEISVDELRSDAQCQLALAAGCDRARKRHSVRELIDDEG
ncbi:MAG TPA: diguanylate cyclase [Polyangiales bacterium]